MATIYGDQNPLDLNDILNGSGDANTDSIYGGDGSDTITGNNSGTNYLYGEDGNDTLQGGSSAYWDPVLEQTVYSPANNYLYGGAGNDILIAGNNSSYWDPVLEEDVVVNTANTLNGGTGNDILSSQNRQSDFIFDANFGRDIILGTPSGGSMPAEGSTIQFNFQRPENLRLSRNDTDLFLDSDEGNLKIEDYFSPDNASIYTISFEDEFGNQTDILTHSDITLATTNGTDGDDSVGVQVDEVPTGIISISGGAGNDWLEISRAAGSSSTLDRQAIVDGGQGNDIYFLLNSETTFIFARDSGKDFIYDAGSATALETVTIQTSNSAGSIDLSDIYASFENGEFYLRINGSDATIAIGSNTIFGILDESKDWNVTDGTNTISVKDLILQIPEIVSGDLVIADTTYDGTANTQGEKIISLMTDITSGSDNEVIVGAASSVKFDANFGSDIVSKSSSSNIKFTQSIEDFSFERNNLDLIVHDVAASENQVVFKDFFLSTGAINTGNTTLKFYDSTSSIFVPMTWEYLSEQISSQSNAENIYLESGEDASAGPATEASVQNFYSDIGGGTTVNGGSGTNIIHSGTGTNIIHDTANGGHDIIGTNTFNSSADNITIIVDDINDLHFSRGGGYRDLVISNSSTGSILYLPLSATLPLLIETSTGTISLYKADILNILESENTNYFLNTGFTEGTYESSFISPLSDTNDIIDGRLNSTSKFGSSVVVDGRGGDDIFYGTASSESIIYNGNGSLHVKGIDESLVAAFGYDSIDISSAGISKADFINNSIRDGNDLIYNNGSVVIEDFFLDISAAEFIEGLSNPAFSENMSETLVNDANALTRYLALVFRNWASRHDSLLDTAHVIDNIKFTDGILRYDEILANFPGIAVPTPDDDILYADQIGNTIDALAGNDTVYGNSAENTFYGNDGDDSLIGEGGNDYLDGGAGADTLAGGTEDDTYIIDDSADVIIENADEGHDLVKSSVSISLFDNENVEDIELTGSENIDATGNDIENFITGNDGKNVIDGGDGGDIMIGGLGDDTYYVDSDLDLIFEFEDQGNDTVYVDSTIASTFYVPEWIENVFITGSEALAVAANASNNMITGNIADNLLEGWDGNDTLQGGGGTDTLAGGTGDDIYILGSSDSGDIIIENASEGIDGVGAAFSYTLGDNIELLGLIGNSSSHINGTGNNLDNLILGSSGNNVLTGLDGIDTLSGGSGNDTYVLGANDSSDIIIESASSGTDTVEAAFSYTMSNTDNLENLTLTGSTSIDGTGNNVANVIRGNSGNNVLNGKAGNDTLIGGLGNDTYVLETAGDTLVESSGEGTDTVISSFNYTLGNHLENLSLAGSSNLTATGNDAYNVLTGNTGNNTLSGGLGNDTLNGGSGGTDVLIGGGGDDVYILETSGDTVTEISGGGNDTVIASYTYSLGTDVENLILAGSSNINGTGTSGNNIIVGNSGNNLITANAGHDTIRGGGGNDSLFGGAGNDVYVLNRNDGADTVTETGDSDVAIFGESGTAINHDQLWFRMSGSNLEVSVIGTSDKFTITSWSTSARQIELFETSDGYELTNTQIANLVSAMASFSPPSAGTFTLDPSTYATVLTQISASWTS